MTGALASQDDADTLRWPIWHLPLGIADVEALACAPPLLRWTRTSMPELAARGVGAVLAARRWYAGKLIVFGRGQELART